MQDRLRQVAGEHAALIFLNQAAFLFVISILPSQVSNRLWVGGLGDWTSEDLLVKEFDRYGCIDRIDYVPGQRHAYIRFADTSAASDACKGMRGFPLGGRDKCIMVDFAR